MSKIINDGLTLSGTGCFVAMYPYGNMGFKGLSGITKFAKNLVFIE